MSQWGKLSGAGDWKLIIDVRKRKQIIPGKSDISLITVS